MNTEEVMEVLRRVEWGGGELSVHHYCPCCRRWKSKGHRDDCKLAVLLSEGEKEAGVGKWSHEGLYITAFEDMGGTAWVWIRLCDPENPPVHSMAEFREALGI